MILLGLMLILAAGGLTLDVVIQNTASINVDALGQTFILSPGWLFVAGVIAGAVALLGVTMILGSVARARRRRNALAGDLYHERAARTSTPDGALDTRGRAPATVEPVVAAPVGTVVMTQADGRQLASSHRHGFLYRRHHYEDRSLTTTAAAAPGSSVGPDDLG
jgi:hypothetical protein